MAKKENIILVTGATGSQGGAVAAALLKSGNTVRIFVRPASARSSAVRQLETAGAQLVLADMEDPASITTAMEGVYGLYSVAGMDDIGAFAAAAFNDTARFDRQAIDLAGDELTIQNMLALIGKAKGHPIKAIFTSEEELVKNGTPADFANFQEWINEVGYNVDLKKLKEYGLPLTSFEQWLTAHFG